MNEKLHNVKRPITSTGEWIVMTGIIGVVLSFCTQQVYTKAIQYNHELQQKIFTESELAQRVIVSEHALRLFLEIPNLEIEQLNPNEKEIVNDFVNRTGFYAEHADSVSNSFDIVTLVKSISSSPFRDNHINALMDQMVLLHALKTKIELKMINSEFYNRVIILDDQVFNGMKQLINGMESADLTDLISIKLTVEQMINSRKYEILNSNKSK